MPELLMLISRTVPVTVSLTVPDDAEEETGLLDELAAGLLEELGACEEDSGALAATSSESSVRNASARKDEPRRCERRIACVQFRQAGSRTEHRYSGEHRRAKHQSILSPISHILHSPAIQPICHSF